MTLTDPAKGCAVAAQSAACGVVSGDGSGAAAAASVHHGDGNNGDGNGGMGRAVADFLERMTQLEAEAGRAELQVRQLRATREQLAAKKGDMQRRLDALIAEERHAGERMQAETQANADHLSHIDPLNAALDLSVHHQAPLHAYLSAAVQKLQADTAAVEEAAREVGVVEGGGSEGQQQLLQQCL
eukprot:Rhum_TRINITY_DN16940_c0_g1::Rhum_TRINITY_DN16940_c0_g1_i1::g.164742::m.164742